MRRGSVIAWGLSGLALWGTAVLAAPEAPAVEKEYDLAEVVKMASENHPQVASAQASVSRGVAGLRQVEAAAQPQVGATLGFSRLSQPPRFRVAPFGTMVFGEMNNGTAAVSVQYPISTGGRIDAMRRQAESGIDGLMARQDRVGQQAGLRAAERYFDVLKADRLTGVVEEQIKALEAQRAAVEKMRAAGLVSKIDLLRTDVALASARESLVKVKSNRAVAMAALAESMGLPADVPLRLSGKYEQAEMPAGTEDAVAEALRKRPELREVQAGVDATDAAIEAARATRRPQIAAYAQADLDRPTYMPKTGLLSAGVVLNLSLWDGNAARAQVAQAQADRARVEAGRKELENGIRLEVTQSFLEVQSSRERIATTEVAVAAAEESQRLATVGYQNGVTPLTDVLQSQADLARAKSDVLVAQFDLRAAEARLLNAMGRPAMHGAAID